MTDSKSTVTDFSLLNAADLPLELGIVIDTSNSQRGHHLEEILKAALDFVNASLRGPDDRVFFLTFDITPEATAWLGKEQLSQFALKVEIGGETALYDAVASACRNRMGPRDWTKPTRREVVVVSDGDDNQSHITRQEAVSEGPIEGGSDPAGMGHSHRWQVFR
ncbi:MAG TPA: VWA domain-containing protein [Terriglobales bacterium]|nr:VWA domain-containing protein [Terriglobales bacterium]